MKVAVLVSGGVDSSVALAKVVAEGGHDITAFYLKIWLEDELSFLGSCPWEEDLKYVRAVCDSLGVPLKIVSLQSEYWDQVVSYVLGELKQGRTPSPDILCNSRIKFGAFLRHIDPSFEKIISGHYASVAFADGKYQLMKGVDPIKDQAYFLSHLNQEQLSRCWFPLGNLMKKEVRKLAADYNLVNKDRADSQGICFLGKINYNDFVEFHLGKKVGAIRELETEKFLGHHEGYWFHTIGQRKGLGLSGGPWYVVKKDIETNTVYVSHNEHHHDNARDYFDVETPHWITAMPNKSELFVKIRHGQHSYPCELDLSAKNFLRVQLKGKDPGVAPGQFAVFYDKEHCLGGGIIH